MENRFLVGKIVKTIWKTAKKGIREKNQSRISDVQFAAINWWMKKNLNF